MKGLITKALLAGCGIGALAAAVQAVEPTKCADPCWPERYSYMARQSVYAVSAPQIRNGHVLDQTVWNYFFETGTDKLTPGGLDKLNYLIRRRPHADTHVFVQTTGMNDVGYDPTKPELFVEKRSELDMKRVQAVEKYLNTASAGRGVSWQVAVHDPGDPSVRAIPIGNSVQQMYNSSTGVMGGGLGGGGFGFGAGGAAGAAGSVVGGGGVGSSAGGAGGTGTGPR